MTPNRARQIVVAPIIYALADAGYDAVAIARLCEAVGVRNSTGDCNWSTGRVSVLRQRVPREVACGPAWFEAVLVTRTADKLCVLYPVEKYAGGPDDPMTSARVARSQDSVLRASRLVMDVARLLKSGKARNQRDAIRQLTKMGQRGPNGGKLSQKGALWKARNKLARLPRSVKAALETY